MSLTIYPPVSPEEQRRGEDGAQRLELQWLLGEFQTSLISLKAGLDECAVLLAPKEPGSTLVLSSLRSENVKGFVTRIGTKVVKGDIHLRLMSLPPNTPRTQTNSNPSTHLTFGPSPSAPDLVLPQLFAIRSLVNDSLDIIDVSRWAGQATDASFISGQLRLLQENLSNAKAYMKGPTPGQASDVPGGEWWTSSVDAKVFQPPLPDHLSLHFTIQDANIVLTIRTLAPSSPGGTPTTPASDSAFSLSGFSLRNKLLGLGPRAPNHDEVGEIFEWLGKQDVIVREKARVETGDPSLMSTAAKLSALEHEVARWRYNLRTVMGEEDD